MKCWFCEKKEGTKIIKEITGKKEKEIHVCPECCPGLQAVVLKFKKERGNQ